MSQHAPQRPEKAYETTDARLAPIAALTAGLTVFVVIVVLAMRAMFQYLDERAASADSTPHPMSVSAEPPAPRLQTTTAADLAAQREREAELLTKYAWVDPQGGVVRIPIERAMQLVVERGLPVRK